MIPPPPALTPVGLFAYPSGGGSYIVSRENLGEYPSLVAGASLLVDYVLTVAVSISAGVAAIISLPTFRGLADQRVVLGLGFIVLLTAANLRGLKESGRVFAAPTYLYIVTLTILLAVGLGRSFFGHIDPVPFDPESFEGTLQAGGSLSLFLILRGFSSGAVALTGVEAISNGVPAFRRPEARNAAITMSIMGALLGSLFLGVSVLAQRLETTVLLLVVGLVVGHIAAGRRQARHFARNEIHRIHRMASFVARGDETPVVILAAEEELVDLLRLASCRFESPPSSRPLPRIERSGTLNVNYHRFRPEGFELPAGGVELPVYGNGALLGRFVLEPTPGSGVSPEQRVMAVAIANQVGAALAASGPDGPGS